MFFVWGIALLFISGVITLFLKDRVKLYFHVVMNAASSIFIIIFALQTLFEGTLRIIFPFYYPLGEIVFLADSLSIFFIMVISFLSFLVSLYGAGYLKQYQNQKKHLTSHLFFFNTLVISMLLVVTIQNALAFLLAWEIMSLSSFFLVVFEHENKKIIKAGIYYFIAMHIGAIFLISAFVLLSNLSGSFDFQVFKEYLANHKKYALLLFFLFFIGFGFKAGFVPLHSWLPIAHPSAPSHISALMSGVMIKTGIYGILRVLTLMPDITSVMSYFTLGIGLLTALFGILYSITQKDLKKVLAYSSIENIGIIGIGIGIGMLGIAYHIPSMSTLGFIGAFLHIINHGLFKTLLFYGAGAVYQQTHTKNIEQLGGLIKKMPVTSAFFLTGALAISALPPLNGFISEFLIYWGVLSALNTNPILSVICIIAIAGISLVGVMAILSFIRAFSVTFLGKPRSSKTEPTKEPHIFMLTAMGASILLIFFIGCFPQFVFVYLEKIISGFMQLQTQTIFYETLNTLSQYLLLFIGMVLALYIIRKLLLRNRQVEIFKTWDCGYQAGNPKMQYTATSYSDTFLTLMRPFLKRGSIHSLPQTLFPKKSFFFLKFKDIIETYFLNPLFWGIQKFLACFAWIQSGKIQHYILYILAFLIITLIWVMAAA